MDSGLATGEGGLKTTEKQDANRAVSGHFPVVGETQHYVFRLIDGECEIPRHTEDSSFLVLHSAMNDETFADAIQIYFVNPFKFFALSVSVFVEID